MTNFRHSICCLTAALITGLGAHAASLPGPLLYVYDANSGQDAGAADAALDGSWQHNNGSDEWDGSRPGIGSPGGAMIERENVNFLERPDVLTIVDTGDPRGSGFPDPGSNRKLFLTRDIPELNFDVGAYVFARWRMDPDPPQKNLDGTVSSFYTLHDDKGQINLGTGSNSVSISYQSPTQMAIKTGGSDTFELIEIADSTRFHTVLATMKANGDGTFAVNVRVDGVDQLAIPSAALTGDIHGIKGLGMGLGSTGRAGAIQIDYIGAGLVPEPAGAVLLFMCLPLWARVRRRRG
jgi:hypothetical protein